MESFYTYLDKGGIIFSFLFFLSLITISIITYKYIEIYILSNLDFSKIIKKISDSDFILNISQIKEEIIDLEPSIKKKLLKKILSTLNSKNSQDQIEQELNAIVENEFKSIQSFMPSLEIISQVSPLVGLLGTVIGMIDSFNELELGGSLVDPSILAGGIWTALLTTAMGLVVAIPALVSHYFLDKKINKLHENLIFLINRLSVIK